MSLSSDAPVERGFGYEVLSHDPAAIDMSRAVRGLPLLYNHDTAQPIGRLEEVGIRADGKLGAMIRFSRNARAQEVKQDVLDGILTGTSIGYRITDWTETRGEQGQPSTYTATRWTPMEGSIVPVPADHTVGTNRSASSDAMPAMAGTNRNPAQAEEHKMAEEVKSPAPVTGVAGVDRSIEEGFIRGVAKTYGMEKEGMDWLDRGLSLEQVRAEVEAVQTKRAQKATPAGAIDLSPKEERSYNLSRAILALADASGRGRDGIEFEVSEEIAKRSGNAPRGLFIPLGMHQRASVTGQIVGTSSLGGAAVQTTLQPLIELLRNRLISRQVGARFLTGLTDTISFPRQITANTFNWTGENPTAANALGALTLNNLTMSPKTGMASTAFSRQVLIQSSTDMQNLVLDDLAMACAIGVDSAVFNGTGSNSQPTGVRATSSIGNRTLGAAGAALSWADLVGLESDVAILNADNGSLGYVTNAAVRGKLKTTLKTTTAGSSFLWEGGNAPGQINGYSAYCSNQLPSNLTQGTSTTICSSIIFGDWSQCLVGLWGSAVDLIVDPYTSKNQNMIEATAIVMCDVGVRHYQSFSKSDAVLTS